LKTLTKYVKGVVPAIALLGAAAVAYARFGEPPSPVIFPDQKTPLRFSHARHVKHKIECDFCHEKASNSQKASDNLIPEEETCETCHPIDREHPERVSKSATACSTCHVFNEKNEVERVVIPSPNLLFNHKVHIAKGIACTHCHGDMSKIELATREQLPKMELCLTCHNSRRGGLNAPSRCATCHLTRPDTTLETQFASGVLRPSGTLRGDTHSIDFKTHHSAVAQNDERYCQNCHRQDFCLACHNGVRKPFDIHGNDYISRHPIEARRNDPDCRACHRLQTFCLSCHERLGVVDPRTGRDGAFPPLGNKRFHPPGWSDPTAAGQPNHHAWQAQRNLRQCVSCHRQETCLECHGAKEGAGARGRFSINPHPPSWRNSSRCTSLVQRNGRMCLQCHAVGDPNLTCR
jgi:hypothetical protein